MKDKYLFDRHVENRRIEIAVLETAEEKGKRKSKIQLTKNALSLGLPFDMIVKVIGLPPSEVQQLSEGVDIDADDDDAS